MIVMVLVGYGVIVLIFVGVTAVLVWHFFAHVLFGRLRVQSFPVRFTRRVPKKV
jgi:hypothetical protein